MCYSCVYTYHPPRCGSIRYPRVTRVHKHDTQAACTIRRLVNAARPATHVATLQFSATTATTTTTNISMLIIIYLRLGAERAHILKFVTPHAEEEGASKYKLVETQQLLTTHNSTRCACTRTLITNWMGGHPSTVDRRRTRAARQQL